MKIELASALYISEVGKRQNNEDAVYPPAMPINLAEGIFVVCDGVGGAAKGEVASRLACDSLAKELKAYNHADIPPNEVITIFNNVHKLFKHT
ncbi:MAG: hypothetical protein EBX41_10545, partial [Chitinophagia bacterium]|nr:hypothetical protein [Chitinophagia bacterium]